MLNSRRLRRCGSKIRIGPNATVSGGRSSCSTLVRSTSANAAKTSGRGFVCPISYWLNACAETVRRCASSRSDKPAAKRCALIRLPSVALSTSTNFHGTNSQIPLNQVLMGHGFNITWSGVCTLLLACQRPGAPGSKLAWNNSDSKRGRDALEPKEQLRTKVGSRASCPRTARSAVPPSDGRPAGRALVPCASASRHRRVRNFHGTNGDGPAAGWSFLRHRRCAALGQAKGFRLSNRLRMTRRPQASGAASRRQLGIERPFNKGRAPRCSGNSG